MEVGANLSIVKILLKFYFKTDFVYENYHTLQFMGEQNLMEINYLGMTLIGMTGRQSSC